MPTQEEKLGRAITRELEAQGHSQSWLATEVARIEGRTEPYSQSAVSKWLSATYLPSARSVFAIEQALKLKPGTLSRLLGYLPVGAVDALSVPAAVDADPRLTVMGRRVILKVYEELVADSPDGSDG